MAFARSSFCATISTRNAWRRHIKGIDYALKKTQNDDLQDGHRPRFVAKRHHGEQGRLDQRQCLREDEKMMSIPPIHEHAGKRRQEERWRLTDKTDHAEQESRVRPTETKDKPTRCHARHPRANERDALADEEEAIVPMSKGARHRSQRRDACWLIGFSTHAFPRD